MKLKKRYLCAVLMIFVLVMITGCGKKEQKVENVIGDICDNSIIIQDDGSIREIACQDFSSPEYDISGLKAEIENQVSDYCGKHSNNAVKFLEYKEETGFVRVALDYKSIEDYNSFNGTSYIVGDMIGLDSAAPIKGVDGIETTIGDVLQNGYKAISVDGALNLTINGEVLYYNSHVTLISGNNVQTDGTGDAIIIYK